MKQFWNIYFKFIKIFLNWSILFNIKDQLVKQSSLSSKDFPIRIQFPNKDGFSQLGLFKDIMAILVTVEFGRESTLAIEHQSRRK